MSEGENWSFVEDDDGPPPLISDSEEEGDNSPVTVGSQNDGTIPQTQEVRNNVKLLNISLLGCIRLGRCACHVCRSFIKNLILKIHESTNGSLCTVVAPPIYIS